MTQIATLAAVQPATMTSIELVDVINSQRKENEAPLTHANFLAKVPKVLGATSHSFECDLPDSYGRPRKGYRFPKREACLMAMSYSYELQAAVYDKMTELEAAQAAPAFNIPQTLPDALRLAADLAEQVAEQGERLRIAAPKVQHYDTVVERDGLLTATQVAQKVGISAAEMNRYLETQGVYNKTLKRGRAFRQWFIDRGLGELKQTSNGYSQCMFTLPGEAWAIERLVSEGYSEVQA